MNCGFNNGFGGVPAGYLPAGSTVKWTGWINVGMVATSTLIHYLETQIKNTGLFDYVNVQWVSGFSWNPFTDRYFEITARTSVDRNNAIDPVYNIEGALNSTTSSDPDHGMIDAWTRQDFRIESVPAVASTPAPAAQAGQTTWQPPAPTSGQESRNVTSNSGHATDCANPQGIGDQVNCLFQSLGQAFNISPQYTFLAGIGLTLVGIIALNKLVK